MSVQQEVGRSRVTAGVDWADQVHAVAIVDQSGNEVERLTVAHTAPDLRRLVTRLRRAGVDEVAIERPDGPVVEALIEAGLTVVVISPNQVKNLRSRHSLGRVTRTTDTTRSCWPTRCAPTGPGSVR